MSWETEVGGALIAFVIALITTPAGVSGAVLLVPVQVSILGVANPALTPTNLLYNVIATPGALLGYRKFDSALLRLLAGATAPGIVIGAVLRVFVLDGAQAFFVVIACVLMPIGLFLVLGRTFKDIDLSRRRIGCVAFAVGVIGGIYGIGGGSLIAPILVGAGLSVAAVAPATLAATFVASVIGVVTFAFLSAVGNGEIAPEWPLGIAMGIGGLLGGYCGARLQPKLPEVAIRRLLGALSVALALRYLVLGLGL